MDTYKELKIGAVKEKANFSRASVQSINIAELMQSMKQQGLINPITVKKNGAGYELIAGHSRLEAAKKLGWTKIPVMVRVRLSGKEDGIDTIAVNINENSIRVSPSFMEEGHALAMLRGKYDMTHNQIATRTGLSPIRVARALNIWDGSVPAKYKKLITPDAKARSRNKRGTATYRTAVAVVNSGKTYNLTAVQKDKLWQQAIKGATPEFHPTSLPKPP